MSGRSKPKYLLGMWMPNNIHKATLQVLGMALEPMKLSAKTLGTIERFLFAAKAVTKIETSDTFEIAVIELRNFLKGKEQYQRQMMMGDVDPALFEKLPPIPEGWQHQKQKRVRNTPESLKAPVTLYPGQGPSVSTKESFYKSWDWRTLRMEVLKEQGRACKCCGSEPGMTDAAGNPVRIVVDHIKPISKFWHLRLDKSNLQILCDECNQGKGNWDQTDFRAPVVPPAPDEWLIEESGVDRGILEQLSVHGETLQ
jgi:5-methylcytosine-specific restriction endonuclease McrA